MGRRLSPSLTLVLVTLLLSSYGSTRFAWIGGPIAALATCGLAARRPVAPARAPVRPTGTLSSRRLGGRSGERRQVLLPADRDPRRREPDEEHGRRWARRVRKRHVDLVEEPVS